MWSQGFIQAVLLMSVFERRLSFRMLHFMKKISQGNSTEKVGSGGTVSFTVCPQRSPSGYLAGKTPDKC